MLTLHLVCTAIDKRWEADTKSINQILLLTINQLNISLWLVYSIKWWATILIYSDILLSYTVMSVSIAFDEVFVQDEKLIHCLKEGNSVHDRTHLKHEKTQNQQVKLSEFGVQIANNYIDTSRKEELLTASVRLGGWGVLLRLFTSITCICPYIWSHLDAMFNS